MLRLRKSILIFPSLLLMHEAIAQKKQFTMAEAVNGMATTLAPKGMKSPAWQPGTDLLYYKDGDKILIYDAKNGKNIDCQNTITGCKWKAGNTWLNKNEWYYQNGDT